MRKGTNEKPAINGDLFREYETYVQDIYGEAGQPVEVLGPPVQTKDPRPEMKSCLEQTVRNKVAKMSFVVRYTTSTSS